MPRYRVDMAIDSELRSHAHAVETLSSSLRSQWRPGWADHRLWTTEYRTTIRWWHEALSAFDEQYANLPDQIRKGHSSAVERGLVYLETAPRCFRSGYLAEQLMHRIALARLNPDQRARAASVVISETYRRQTRGWRYIGALAGAVWCEGLEGALHEVITLGGIPGHRATKIAEAAATWQLSTRSHPVRRR